MAVAPPSPMLMTMRWPSGREARREGHAGEIADELALARLQVHEEHARLVAGVLHVGDFLRGRAEARGEHQLAPLAQQPHVGAVLVHDGEALVAAVLGAGLVDEHDLRVEVALLAGKPLIDLVGDQVPEPAPLALADDEALGCQLPARDTSHSRNSATTRPSGARPARPTTSAWALITRQSWKRGGTLRSRGRSMKEARSSGWNRPERSRSAATTSDTSSANCGSSPRNSGTAMGMGCRVPCADVDLERAALRPGRALRRRRLPHASASGARAMAAEEAASLHPDERRASRCAGAPIVARHAVSLSLGPRGRRARHVPCDQHRTSRADRTSQVMSFQASYFSGGNGRARMLHRSHSSSERQYGSRGCPAGSRSAARQPAAIRFQAPARA